MDDPFLMFDLDGTLSDPLEGIARSINYALSHFGHETLPVSAVGAFVGPPLDESFRTITGIRKDGKIRAFIAKYRECYFETGFAENTLYPGIREILAELSGRGAAMGICTSKRQDIAEKILTLFGIRHHFHFVSGGDVGIRKWQQIESLLAVKAIPHHCIMIGDRDVDLSAAHRNGIRSAGVLWGYGSVSELEACSPLWLLENPSDLLQIL
jgi:phosphoglycolate phosphatase